MPQVLIVNQLWQTAKILNREVISQIMIVMIWQTCMTSSLVDCRANLLLTIDRETLCVFVLCPKLLKDKKRNQIGWLLLAGPWPTPACHFVSQYHLRHSLWDELFSNFSSPFVSNYWFFAALIHKLWANWNTSAFSRATADPCLSHVSQYHPRHSLCDVLVCLISFFDNFWDIWSGMNISTFLTIDHVSSLISQYHLHHSRWDNNLSRLLISMNFFRHHFFCEYSIDCSQPCGIAKNSTNNLEIFIQIRKSQHSQIAHLFVLAQTMSAPMDRN